MRVTLIANQPTNQTICYVLCPSSVSDPSRVYRCAHRKRRLDALNERPLHELLFGEHTRRLCFPMPRKSRTVSNRARSG
jgi:hypothetical protein